MYALTRQGMCSGCFFFFFSMFCFQICISHNLIRHVTNIRNSFSIPVVLKMSNAINDVIGVREKVFKLLHMKKSKTQISLHVRAV